MKKLIIWLAKVFNVNLYLNTVNIAGLFIGTLDVTEGDIYLNEVEFQFGNDFTYHLILEYTKL